MVIKLFLERLNGLLGTSSCLTYNVVCFFARLMEEFLFRLLKCSTFCAKACLSPADIRFFFIEELIFFLINRLGTFQIVNNGFKLGMILADIFFRPCNDLLRQTELAADGKGIACPRYTDEQTIGRTERLEIKLNRCIFNALLGIRIRFEICIMRCRNSSDAIHKEMFDDTPRKSSALIRISSRADLI